MPSGSNSAEATGQEPRPPATETPTRPRPKASSYQRPQSATSLSDVAASVESTSTVILAQEMAFDIVKKVGDQSRLAPAERYSHDHGIDEAKCVVDRSEMDAMIEKHVMERLNRSLAESATREDAMDKRLKALEGSTAKQLGALEASLHKDAVRRYVSSRTVTWASARWTSVFPHTLPDKNGLPDEHGEVFPRPFASAHFAKSSARGKATWASNQYNTLGAIPDSHNATAVEYPNMEQELVEQVLIKQPRNQSFGYSEVALRDMANSVVREIVGVFDSLLDRLLKEKQDSIRDMVAQHMTGGLAATIATGHEQLKKKEFGHFVGELERLRLEMADSARRWEERFAVTTELRESQGDLWSTLDGRLKQLEARVLRIESGFATRTELITSLDSAAKATQSLDEKVCKAFADKEEIEQRIADQASVWARKYATKDALSMLDRRFDGALSDTRDEFQRNIAETRELAASKAALASLSADHEEMLGKLDQRISKAAQDYINLASSLLDVRTDIKETCATKSELTSGVTDLQRECTRIEERMQTHAEHLDHIKATKSAVEEVSATLHRDVLDLRQRLGVQTSGLEKMVVDLQNLGQRCDKTLATREYAFNMAKTLSDQVAQECNDKEPLAQLRREFELERDHMRQTVRQQQNCRKDINDTSEEVHKLQQLAAQLQVDGSGLRQQFDGLNLLEQSRWKATEAAHAEHKQAHEKLEASHRDLREEVKSHAEVQRQEGDKLYSHSTHRYFEQMDKALKLSNAVDRIDTNHRDINDTLRHIKLPRV